VAEPAGREARWVFPETGETSLQPGQTRAEAEFRLCHHGRDDFGRDWISAWGPAGQLDGWLRAKHPTLQTVDFATLERWRVLALGPRVDAEITDATIPLEIGLRSAVAENKGCYPGQEVIERITSLGAPPRRLALLTGKGSAPAPGSKIFSAAEPPAEVGEITSVARQEDGSIAALGLVRKIHAKEGLEVKWGTGDRASIVRISTL
jgi:folate-binding protein YgfZ